MSKILTCAVSFSKEEVQLVASIIEEARGPSAFVMSLANLLSKAGQSLKESTDFSIADLGVLANLVNKYQGFGVKDVPTLLGLSALLKTCITELETYANEQNSEKENEPKEKDTDGAEGSARGESSDGESK